MSPVTFSTTVEYMERVWVDFILSLRIEDGQRYVLDNELEFHDMWTDGTISVEEISRLAREHWVGLTSTSTSSE